MHSLWLSDRGIIGCCFFHDTNTLSDLLLCCFRAQLIVWHYWESLRFPFV